MKIILDSRKSVNENAASFYENSKQAKKKLAALLDAEKQLAKESASARKLALEEPKPKELKIKVVREREWFEKFKFFATSGGLLCVAGKDAKQNDSLFAHNMEDGDLFFHSDIQGAAFTLLKGGVGAPRQDKLEAAQWAACHSSAWKRGFSTVDVYSCRKEQLSKASQGEFVGKGAFVMKGQREWFKNTELAVAVGVDSENNLAVVPKLLEASFSKKTIVFPGEKKENALAAAKVLGLQKDVLILEKLMRLLP